MSNSQQKRWMACVLLFSIVICELMSGSGIRSRARQKREADVIEERNLSEPERQKAPGTVICAEKEAFIVRASQGALRITSLQLEGKKRMSADDFLRGYSIDTGTVLRKER